MIGDQTPLKDFNGRARLFPLPNLVLFPAVIQPLHIFEPRYRQMTADALAGDRLIALALLKPSTEESGTPPLHAIACLGRIFNEEALPDGKYNFLLHGLSRIRIVHELPQTRLYRMARVELVSDEPPQPAAAKTLRRDFGKIVPGWFASHGGAVEQIEKLLKSDLSLGALCDIFGFALPLEVGFKQTLLEEVDVARRARSLIDHLGANTPPAPSVKAGSKRFPPEFSVN